MPTKITERDLKGVTDAESLLLLLAGKLDWPLVSEDPDEILVRVGDAAGRVPIRQLLRFRDDDPFLVLLVELPGTLRRDGARDALREIRRQMREEGRWAGKRVSDLLFIVAGEGYERVEFVRFVERGSRSPKLKAFGWDRARADHKTVREVSLPALALAEAEDGGPDWAKAKWNKAWDVETVTKEFFKGFDALRKDTLGLIAAGVRDEEAAGWATSVMLNRLLFVYFLADQGFLPGGVAKLRQELDRGEFGARYFLPLCLDALGREGPNPPGMEGVPYLNGGLFTRHPVEEAHDVPALPDGHYRKWLDFLGGYRWTLSESESVNTISPHILGYLFERYINQKQMGAYYTKEDVTGYICRSTIVPRLFDLVGETYPGAVRLNLAFLSDDGVRRYLFPSVKGPSKLPTETDYEQAQRSARVARIEGAAAGGEIASVDDFVTHNLDLELLAEDFLAGVREPSVLLAAYDALSRITVLDPTCGSGAFLLAALEVLAPLYDVALRRMRAMVEEAGESAPEVNWAGELNLTEAFDQGVLADPAEAPAITAMRERLAEVAKHPNSDYFVRKRILLRNLYGVDLMPEAVEICKLRLYLALVSAAQPGGALEPLPDVDLNYRAGNALVGFATLEDVQRHYNPGGMAGLEFAEERLIRSSVAKIREINRRQEAGEVPHDLIDEVLAERSAAVMALDREQATLRNLPMDAAFVKSHHPFHWMAEFPTVMLDRGGFDVIVGNPPWVETSTIRDKYELLGYETLRTGNLYVLVTERALAILAGGGRFSFIVQLPIVCADRMNPARELLRRSSARLHVATFGDRPSKLFEGLENCRSTIFLLKQGSGGPLLTTRYHRWSSEFRPHLVSSIEYAPTPERPFFLGVFPKSASDTESGIFARLLERRAPPMSHHLGVTSEHFVYYQEAVQYWTKATIGIPGYRKNGLTGTPGHGRFLYFPDEQRAFAIAALLNSSLFYAYFVAVTDCFHLTANAVEGFPTPHSVTSDSALAQLGARLMDDLHANADWSRIETKKGDVIEYETFYGRQSKSIIDEIDRTLAKHYDLLEEELDFVLNYDAKFRMGRNSEEAE